MLGGFAQDAAAGPTGLVWNLTDRVIGIGEDDLKGRVHHVPDEQSGFPVALRSYNRVTDGVAGGRLDPQIVIEHETVVNQNGDARFDAGQNAVFEYQALAFVFICSCDRLPMFILCSAEDVFRIREGWHPSPVDQPRVPAYMIGVKMGAHDVIDLVDGYPMP